MTDFRQAASELRQQEIERLTAATAPRLESLRSGTVCEFRDVVATLLSRHGHEIIAITGKIITTKDGSKFVTFCHDPLDREPARMPSLRKLHDVVIAANARRGFYVTTRHFSEEAKHYPGPMDLIDGEKLVRMLVQSLDGRKMPETYKAMCGQCGDTMKFHLDDNRAKPCKDGHEVAPTLTRSMIVPPQVPPPAPARKPRRGPQPGARVKPPSPRPPGGRHAYATPRAAIKARRKAWNRRAREINLAQPKG